MLRKTPIVSFKTINSTTDKNNPKHFVESDDMTYDLDDDDNEDEDDDEEYDDDDDDEDEDDDDDEDDDEDEGEDDPNHLNEDEIMNQCPANCKCVAQIASATTAK